MILHCKRKKTTVNMSNIIFLDTGKEPIKIDKKRAVDILMFLHNENQVMYSAPTINRGNIAIIVDTSKMQYPTDCRKDGAGVYLYTGTKTTSVMIHGAKFIVKVGYAHLKSFPDFMRTEYWLPGLSD